MALAERTPPSHPRSHTCSIASLLDEIDRTEADVLNRWLSAPVHEIQHSWIAAQLTDEYGYRFGGDTVGRHRNGKCSCGTR